MGKHESGESFDVRKTEFGQPPRKRRGLKGPESPKPQPLVGPDGTVRGIRTLDEAKELSEEFREQSRESDRSE